MYWAFGGGHSPGISVVFVVLAIGLSFFRMRNRGRRGGPSGGGGRGPYGPGGAGPNGGGGFDGGPPDIRPPQDITDIRPPEVITDIRPPQDSRPPQHGMPRPGGAEGTTPPDDPSNPSDL